MCGRFNLTVDLGLLAEMFGFEPTMAGYVPRYNIAPTQSSLVVPNTPSRELQVFGWGLVPSWAKDRSIGQKMINARAETVAEKPAFRAAFKRRRCLVPATGFYEWRGSAKPKQPFHIHKQDGKPFAMAGLWETWTDPEGNELPTFAIITTDANPLMRAIHDRMPVILGPEAYRTWLEPDEADRDDLGKLLRPYPGDDFVADPIARTVNNPKNDGPECLEAADG